MFNRLPCSNHQWNSFSLIYEKSRCFFFFFLLCLGLSTPDFCNACMCVFILLFALVSALCVCVCVCMSSKGTGEVESVCLYFKVCVCIFCFDLSSYYKCMCRKGVWGSPNISRPSCLGQSMSRSALRSVHRNKCVSTHFLFCVVLDRGLLEVVRQIATIGKRPF